MLRALPDMMFRLDAQGHFLHYHAGLGEALYTAPEQFLGRRLDEVFPAPMAGRFIAAIEKVLSSGEVQIVQYMLPVEGQLIWFEARMVPMQGGQVLAVVRNIHEAQQVRMRLEESEARFRAVVSNIPGAIYRMRCDEHWTTSFISDAIEGISGYPASDFLMNRVRSFASIIHPEDRVRIQREVDEALEGGAAFELEYRMLHASGAVRWVTDRGQGVRVDEDGEAYVDGVILDMTEWRNVQQKLLVNRQMAAVGALAAGVAHEINNPLAIIMANLEYAVEELGELGFAMTAEPQLGRAVEDVRAAVDKIGDSVERVRRIIADMRSFSDAAEQRAGRVHVERVLEWAIQRLSDHHAVHGTIERHFEAVPTLWANELGLLQVFTHLLSNAAQALPRGGQGRIDVRLFEDKEEASIIVEIADTGSGMNEVTMERIFEPFFTTRGVGGGTGLGLFVSRGIVQGLGGAIEVESTPGEGSLFRVILPCG